MSDMTKEEAITALGDRNNLLWGMSKEEQKYYSEALDMAISALKEEPVPFDFELFQAGLMDIPKGMTNGEVIKALFPEARKSEFEYTYSECIKLPYHTKHDTGLLFDKDWWNAPYKAESEVKAE